MGIGYEFIRLAGKYQNPVTAPVRPRSFNAKATTLSPLDDIIEVGIAALKAVTDEECCKAAKAAPKEKRPKNLKNLRKRKKHPQKTQKHPKRSIEAPESPRKMRQSRYDNRLSFKRGQGFS